jgi:hypothetical protein
LPGWLLLEFQPESDLHSMQRKPSSIVLWKERERGRKVPHSAIFRRLATISPTPIRIDACYVHPDRRLWRRRKRRATCAARVHFGPTLRDWRVSHVLVRSRIVLVIFGGLFFLVMSKSRHYHSWCRAAQPGSGLLHRLSARFVFGDGCCTVQHLLIWYRTDSWAY